MALAGCGPSWHEIAAEQRATLARYCFECHDGAERAADLSLNTANSRNETPLHGVMYRGGSVQLIDFLVERGADPRGVVNSRGWTPLRIADGLALNGLAFIRYPEAAAHLRSLLGERGLPVPPVEWDGPRYAGQ